MHTSRLVTLIIATAALAVAMIAPRNAEAASTIDANHAFAWAGNFGWTNWLPTTADGVAVNERYCAGYIYAANVGWISMGVGTPADGSAYSNAGSSDYGVNSTPAAAGEQKLRGFAYGANIGWISFEDQGNPRVIIATGQLRGFVWSANCGWINLDDADFYVKTTPLTPIPDPSPSPTASPIATVTPNPSATPTPSTTPTPGPSSTPGPSASPSPTGSPSPTPGSSSHLANISTRLRVGSGDDVLIAGVILQGSGSKKIVVRGIGPSLPLASTLTDPTLALYDASSTLLAINDDWLSGNSAAEISLIGLSPTNPKESALLTIVQPSLYTAVLRGADGGTGNAVMEVYDLETDSLSEIVNISTRGFVDLDDNVMIGGFIITGNTPLTVLIRGVGPSLTAANVPNVLLNPALELHNGNGDVIYFDDDWRDTQEAALLATGLQPSNDAEAAIIISLVPGNYTAIVRGADGGVGNGLLEVYKLSH
jgi:hypothetical protein